MKVDRLDHLVLTVEDIDATCAFYTRVLGMEVVSFGAGRKALSFGSQKINLQQQGKESTLAAAKPTPGSADLCFVTSTPLVEVSQHLAACGVQPIAGPVERQGARGPMMSIYFRDPDLNLIEISTYMDP
ncbi:MAG TPA: VOC family protein [Candidatus Acidoferrales bacterium]|nr:VOC family protein [Candidatus Acidoferrales bacterium]